MLSGEAEVTDGMMTMAYVDLARAYGDSLSVAVTVCVTCGCSDVDGPDAVLPTWGRL